MERSVSFTEVAAHNRVSDCWVVIRGIVYDVTPFMGLHPGGPTVILPVAGKDATAAFEQIGHSQYAREHLETLRVGVLAGGAAEGCEPGGPLLRTATGGMIGLAGLIPIPCSSCGAALPESSDVCYSCKQAPAEACERQQLQLGGRILQPGEVVHGALAAQDQPTTTIPANQPTPKVPATWQPFWQGGWQAVGCPTCGPTCASPTVHAQLSLEEYVKRGEAAARRDEWSQALDWYHEAIGVINPSTPAEAAASVYTAASNVQRELGKMRSALRFADRGVMACATAAPAHAARGAALEALGLVVDAHAACAEAGRLQPSQAVHAEAAARLLPFCRLLLSLNDGCTMAASEATVEVAARPAASESGLRLLTQWRRIIDEWKLAPHLIPLPTPARILSDDEFYSSRPFLRQQRLSALFAVDAAVSSSRGQHGGHTACNGVYRWLLSKASELGLNIVEELISAAIAEDDDEDDGGDAESASESSEHEDAEGPMVSEEVELSSGLGRVLLQMELAPLRQLLTVSLVSLNAADLGEEVFRCTFAVGLTSAYLLEAFSLQHDRIEFAEWRTAARGSFRPPDLRPPAATLERLARAFVTFFSHGEGAQSPLAPRNMPAPEEFSNAEF